MLTTGAALISRAGVSLRLACGAIVVVGLVAYISSCALRSSDDAERTSGDPRPRYVDPPHPALFVPLAIPDDAELLEQLREALEFRRREEFDRFVEHHTDLSHLLQFRRVRLRTQCFEEHAVGIVRSEQ